MLGILVKEAGVGESIGVPVYEGPFRLDEAMETPTPCAQCFWIQEGKFNRMILIYIAHLDFLRSHQVQ